MGLPRLAAGWITFFFVFLLLNSRFRAYKRQCQLRGNRVIMEWCHVWNVQNHFMLLKTLLRYELHTGRYLIRASFSHFPHQSSRVSLMYSNAGLEAALFCITCVLWCLESWGTLTDVFHRIYPIRCPVCLMQTRVAHLWLEWRSQAGVCPRRRRTWRTLQ